MKRQLLKGFKTLVSGTTTVANLGVNEVKDKVVGTIRLYKYIGMAIGVSIVLLIGSLIYQIMS